MDLAALAIALGAPTLVGLVGAQILILMRRRLVRAWQEAAAAAGVKNVVPGFSILSRQILAGTIGSRRVRVDEYAHEDPHGRQGRNLLITVEGSSGVTLRAESSVTPLERIGGSREIELGDERFDGIVYVHGPEDHLRAVLDSSTRAELANMIRDGLSLARDGSSLMTADVTIRDGDVVAEFKWNEAGARAHLPRVLSTMVDVARRLERPTSLVKRIVDNTREEPEWQVRLGNLRLLANSHPHHPATRDALERGCQDERQAVQLECALALGVEQAEATLTEIAGSEWADDADAARAVAGLGRRLSEGKLLGILAHALRTRRHDTAGACIEILGRVGGPNIVAPLAKVLALEKGVLAACAAHALGVSKDAAAEGPLLRALSNASPSVSVVAAEALGQVGTASAVLPLKEAAEGTHEVAFRKAAREAIAAIQARLGGASPGQLSLAEGEAGQLSLADEDPRGRVSVVEPRGRERGKEMSSRS